LKRSSYSGLCPGLLKWIPDTWIAYLCHIFNVVFCDGEYPLEWQASKLTILFKKGDRMNCGNYRGLSIMDTLSKVYDILLNERLKTWVDVNRAQAGAQKHRSCIEQIVALRLLCEFCVKKKKKLYMVFIDFKKAYDLIPRNKLLECLKRKGCGRIMLQALGMLYKKTAMVLNDTEIDTCIGVKQGAPTSCILFIIYMDFLIRKLKDDTDDDDFLGSLHCMLYMDDAVILATSKEKCLRKLNSLIDFCEEYGMTLNATKTKFMVVNKEKPDAIPLTLRNITIEQTDHYCYLGEHFFSDGKSVSAIKRRAQDAQKHVNKLSIFLQRNRSMPFHLKKRVLEACVLSAMLYGSESWFTEKQCPVEKLYFSAIKMTLGVRKTTPNVICLIEIGLPDIQTLIREKRASLMSSATRHSTQDDPILVALRICTDANTQGARLLNASTHHESLLRAEAMRVLADFCREKSLTATRFRTYVELNPTLDTHAVYLRQLSSLEEHHRLAFTRIRLSSHELRIETGRWSRTPREERRCGCSLNTVQDETHVTFTCPKTEEIRSKYPTLLHNVQTLRELMAKDIVQCCAFFFDILNVL